MMIGEAHIDDVSIKEQTPKPQKIINDPSNSCAMQASKSFKNLVANPTFICISNSSIINNIPLLIYVSRESNKK